MLREARKEDNKKEFYRNGTGFQFFQDQFSGFHRTAKYEEELLVEIKKIQGCLLRRIEEWKECPSFYRHKLFLRLRSIDISRKEAFLKIDDVKRELRMLAFNLSLNPIWIRGLLKLIDEILDQTESQQRKTFSKECRALDRHLLELERACRLYQVEKNL